MTVIERILGRFGYVKMDPYRRLLLAQAERGAGLTLNIVGPPPLPPAALTITPADPPRRPRPPQRTARGSTPPPIPRSCRRVVASPTPVRAPVDAAPDKGDNEEEEWEWRLAIARARTRAG